MHLMTNGKECGRPDGHTGKHKSREAANAAQARYKRTAKGMLTDMRFQAKRRGNSSGSTTV